MKNLTSRDLSFGKYILTFERGVSGSERAFEMVGKRSDRSTNTTFISFKTLDSSFEFSGQEEIKVNSFLKEICSRGNVMSKREMYCAIMHMKKIRKQKEPPR